MVSKKLQCKVPSNLGKEITQLRIKLGTKGKALDRLMKTALADTGAYPGDGKYGPDETISCTLTVSEEYYNSATLSYRTTHSITTANAFFKQALQHGALVLANTTAPPAVTPETGTAADNIDPATVGGE